MWQRVNVELQTENFKLACGTWTKISSKYSSPALSFHSFSDRMVKPSQKGSGEFLQRAPAITNSAKSSQYSRSFFFFSLQIIKYTSANGIKANHFIAFAFKITVCSMMFVWTATF